MIHIDTSSALGSAGRRLLKECQPLIRSSCRTPGFPWISQTQFSELMASLVESRTRNNSQNYPLAPNILLNPLDEKISIARFAPAGT